MTACVRNSFDHIYAYDTGLVLLSHPSGEGFLAGLEACLLVNTKTGGLSG
jgi:hypothetical protein